MRRTIVTLIAAVMLAACGTSRDKQIEAISQHELQLSTIDIGTADEAVAQMLGLYRQFAADFPDDSLAPVYLMRAADVLGTHPNYLLGYDDDPVRPKRRNKK